MPPGQPDPMELNLNAIARARAECDQTIVRLRSLFEDLIHSMNAVSDLGIPQSIGGMDFKDPVGNAAWREHTRKAKTSGRTLDIPLMDTEDQIADDHVVVWEQ